MHIIPVIDMAATGINITRLRQNAGMTVRDLQEVFGFTTPQAIYKWQRGEAMPTLDNIVVLAAVERYPSFLSVHRGFLRYKSVYVLIPHCNLSPGMLYCFRMDIEQNQEAYLNASRASTSHLSFREDGGAARGA